MAEKNIIEGLPSTLINSGRQTAVSPLCGDTLSLGQRGSAAPQRVRCSEVVAGGLSRSLGESAAVKPYSGTTLEGRLFYKRGELGACLVMGIEYLVARVRLREVSLVSESNTCLLKFCLQFIWIRYSHNTLLYSMCW